MSKKDRREIVEIEIYDQRYPLRLNTPAAKEDVRKLALEVDLRMREIAEHTGTVDSLKVAILTALHLAEEKREEGESGRELEAAIHAGADKWIEEIDRLL